MFDLLISNGLVYDGTGGAAFPGDILVSGEKIADVIRRAPGNAGPAPEAATVIDAAGRIVTPGFVDAHSHSDFNVLANPNVESKLRQGITTEIIGQCGDSAFPLAGAALEAAREDNRRIEVDIDWSDIEGYCARVAAARPAVNLATFVGHGTIRGAVIGNDDRPPSPDELGAMVREVEKAMGHGAWGVSTGLIYPPGFFAGTDEIVALMRVAARRGGIYSSHVRGEGDTLLEAADEFLKVVEQADCQGQFSHLKACGPANWGKTARVVNRIEQANSNGGRIRFDKYPYIASSTSLASLLPRWARDGGPEAVLRRLADPQLRSSILREAKVRNEGRDGWNSVLICSADCSEYDCYQGKTIGEIAALAGKDPDDVFLDLLAKSRLLTSICNFTMSQEETDLVLQHPLGMVCTDSGARAPYGPLAKDTPHPRAYGTFGKFFRDYVKEQPRVSLEAAVAKATSLPCDTFGFRQRGRLAPGYFADILVIDWPRFEDRARFSDPHHYCEGIDAIIVNGTLTLHRDQLTGQRNGQVLLKS